LKIFEEKDKSKKSEPKKDKSQSNSNTTGVSIAQGSYLNTQLPNPGNVPTWK